MRSDLLLVVALGGLRGMLLWRNISFLLVSLSENFHHFGCVMDFLQVIDGWSWLQQTHLVRLLPLLLRQLSVFSSSVVKIIFLFLILLPPSLLRASICPT